MSRILIIFLLFACVHFANGQLINLFKRHGDIQPSNESPSYITPNVFFITQRVDNFNLHNTDSFEQRYDSIGNYYEEGGPLYVILADH